MQRHARISRTTRTIAIATLIAGTLDIAAAVFITLSRGGTTGGMLRGIASGPLPDATRWGLAGAAIGLAVHFAIIAAMAAVYVLAARRLAWLRRQPVTAGALYGVVTWAVMNQLVLPLRWPGIFPQLDAVNVFTQLACHIFLVGIPIALIARR
ncbi:MAG: hypothetical protein EOP59_14760 [Sphingomonadales bacterium]|nr:MAG: hypothetical protein EOP59_14760 [Sphingomonadales bacterium]